MSTPCVDYASGRFDVVNLQGKLKLDIAQILPKDASLFVAEYGIDESSP